MENTELRERLSAAHRGTSAAHWENLSQASKTAVFGSSINRDIDEGKLLNTTCICIPGGKITDIKEAVKKFPTTIKLSRAVLMVGGNDSDDRDKQTVDINDLVNEYSDLIASTKEIASSMCVSSVCPRARSPQVKEWIDGLNAALSILCGDHAVEFVNHDPSFYLQEGNVNDGYLLPDGVHLSRAATNKLVTNLKLPLRHGEVTAHVDHRRRGAKPPGKPTHQGTMPTNPPSDRRPPQQPRPPAYPKAGTRQNGRPPPPPSVSPRQQPVRQQVARQSQSPGGPRARGHSGKQPGQHPYQRPYFQPGPQQINIPNMHAPSITEPAPTRANTTNTLRIRKNNHNFDTRSDYSPPQPVCQLCLGSDHEAVSCKSKDALCYNCHQKGHFARACSL